MASSSQFLSLPFLLFNLFFLITFSFGNLIPNVCKQIKNEKICEKLLESNPKSKTSNLVSLEYIAINFAISHINATNDKVNSLLLDEKDSKLRNIYGNCSINYEEAMDFLQETQLYLEYKQFMDLGYYAKDANLDINFCEESFKKAKLPSPLAKNNYILSLLIDIVVVISNMLVKTI